MPSWSLRDGVELFHLAFLGEFGTKLDKARYAVKGGCNLRFFFHSIRYSEDLDLDVGNVPVTTLARNVTRVLESRSLRVTLKTADVVVSRISAPKQTDTTQRWKLLLDVSGSPASTRIEFSRRHLDEGRELGPADPVLVARYGLSPLLCSHYNRLAALHQKARALVGRSEAQARDVFDLDLLLASADATLELSPKESAAVVERAASIDADSFRAQVVAFLPPEQQPLYDSPEIWEAMVRRVIVAVQGKAT